MEEKPVVLCVDDEKAVLDSLEEQIEVGLEGRVEVELAERGEEALELLYDLARESRPVALIISDQIMPGMRGDDFLAEAHKIAPDAYKILLTGQTSLEAVRNAINKANLYRYIAKPWEPEDLTLTVEEAFRSYRQARQLDEYTVYTKLLRLLNKSAREISSEIDIHQLIDKFLNIAIECTEAHRGILILRKEDHFEVEALATAGQEKANRFKVFGEKEIEILTTHLMENIDLLLEMQQVNGPQIAAKITHKENELGYIYLEQMGQSKRGFSNYQRDLLEMLASQAAVSIENAQLYSKVSEQARALKLEKEKVEQVNDLVEQKNEDITDSIKYAKRIQQAYLPYSHTLKTFFPKSFVLLMPRDIVSGDFYWWHQDEFFDYVCAADCTGHGVPGAIMSVIGATTLNQTVVERGLSEPAGVLNAVDAVVRRSLNQDTPEVKTSDGMDLAFCRFTKDRRELVYAGAYRPLLILREREFLEFTPTKISVGSRRFEGQATTYQQERINLQKGDRVYMFSDGYPDQFGGEKHKKYSARRFKETLLQLLDYPMEEQGDLLKILLNDWRGDVAQTDDVIVLGIEIE